MNRCFIHYLSFFAGNVDQPDPGALTCRSTAGVLQADCVRFVPLALPALLAISLAIFPLTSQKPLKIEH
jgi:hypothetical protein